MVKTLYKINVFNQIGLVGYLKELSTQRQEILYTLKQGEARSFDNKDDAEKIAKKLRKMCGDAMTVEVTSYKATM